MCLCLLEGMVHEVLRSFLVVGGVTVMNVEGFVLCTVGKMAQDVGMV